MVIKFLYISRIEHVFKHRKFRMADNIKQSDENLSQVAEIDCYCDKILEKARNSGRDMIEDALLKVENYRTVKHDDYDQLKDKYRKECFLLLDSMRKNEEILIRYIISLRDIILQEVLCRHSGDLGALSLSEGIKDSIRLKLSCFFDEVGTDDVL
ncbi:hypothetical protein GUI12_04310 [Anaplasmataceae bacterium AB001_6]|nr:hypothetical protein GUI12_04310 [Anaplasmataceae bacterium AB001_6]